MERHSSSSSSSCFVVDVEKMLADDSADSRWEAPQHTIYLVPEWLKGANTKAYQPQLVSLGPFHHDDSNLKPMEEHKRRAVVSTVNWSKTPVEDFLAAINGDADKLMAAHGKDLHPKWRKDRQSFVEMMLTGGCFLLEFMRAGLGEYDPVFSTHGKNSLSPVIRSDMLLVENQLPLLVLKKTLRIAHPDLSDYPEDAIMDEDVNLMVLKSLGREHEGRDIATISLRPHPLELYHGSLTFSARAAVDYPPENKYEMMPSALEMHKADIKLTFRKADKLLDIRFNQGSGVLTMPVVVVDDSTKSLYLNLMAFERLNAGASDVVTAYMICMDNMLFSTKRSSKGVLENMLGCDEETDKLINGTLSEGQLMRGFRSLHEVTLDVKAYCSKRWHKWRATLIRTYFRNPWAIISLAAAAILLIDTVLRTVYTLLDHY